MPVAEVNTISGCRKVEPNAIYFLVAKVLHEMIVNIFSVIVSGNWKLIKAGLCWLPRLMRWKSSKGEVAPVFAEKSNGCSYSVYGYMNVETKEGYSKDTIQREIKAHNLTDTVEQVMLIWRRWQEACR